jgi:hypothetical protein
MGRTHDITISGFDLDRVEAELKYLIEKAETLEIRHAALMLHTQTVVDENTKLREICMSLENKIATAHNDSLRPRNI